MDLQIIQRLLNLTTLGTEWVLWLLFVLSIVSMGIIIERSLFFFHLRVNFEKFVQELTNSLVANDFEHAKAICRSNRSIEARVALQGLENYAQGEQSMRESMEGFLLASRPSLDRGLVVLSTLGNNAPFIGLFGTVLGIIQAFHDLSINPQGGPTVVMSSLSEALIATAVGLFVAIPAVVANNTLLRFARVHQTNSEAIINILLAHKFH